MSLRSNRQRRQTPANRQPGARDKARGSLSQAVVTVREAAVEQSKELVTKASERVGQVAGAGLSVATVQVASALGHQASPWMIAGAVSAGVAIGGFTGKVANRTIDKLHEAGGPGGAGGATGGPGGAGGAAAEVMVRLSEVLQALEAVSRAVDEAVETIGLAQGRVAQATRGSRNELARVANASLRDAPRQLREGVAEVTAGRELVEQFLVKVAGGRG
jgi:hypothetical protein